MKNAREKIQRRHCIISTWILKRKSLSIAFGETGNSLTKNKKTKWRLTCSVGLESFRAVLDRSRYHRELPNENVVSTDREWALHHEGICHQRPRWCPFWSYSDAARRSHCPTADYNVGEIHKRKNGKNVHKWIRLQILVVYRVENRERDGEKERRKSHTRENQ
jgi:hypothetical protein